MVYASSSLCHLYALKDNIRIHGSGNAPSYDLAAVEVHDACKVDKAIVIGPDVGDVGAPEGIRLFGIEMPVEDVFQLIYLGFMPSFFMMPRTYFCDTLSSPLLLISAAILGDP